jgi:hypothetical protein
MTPEIIIPDQLWLIRDFFPQEQYAFVRNLYRKAENNALKMIYDNRLLTDWSETREPNDICATWAPFFSELAGIELKPQVGYVDITLSHAKIMMHRIHSDIKLQVQIPLCTEAADTNQYAFCIEDAVNNVDGENDHSPVRNIEHDECLYVPHEPRSAIVYQNNPRIFNGMMNSIPENSIRETLWLNYQ